GIFDLAFADPPYNLKKSYDKYQDALAERNYIEWCNHWLYGMVKTLKPGGSLIVLNLPKWAIHHAAFLNNQLEFRHWIVWDALSDPRGKIMPAHYALLYYTKPGATPVFNYSACENAVDSVLPPDSPQYCLRASCIKRRKRSGDDKKVELSDIWSDIHRIKHKRYRDAHPCQLPEKLMERIIMLTTYRGGLVFDPFCGTGTTAIVAHKLGRSYITIDIDPNYGRITAEKLLAMRENLDLSGNLIVPRQPTKKPKTAASKKEVEIYLQKLAKRLGREPSEADIQSDNADMLRKIDLIYPSRLAAIKRCRIALKDFFY
ncbi:MAG: DNA methyltransferase, partial [Acidobacteriota bacterium]